MEHIMTREAWMVVARHALLAAGIPAGRYGNKLSKRKAVWGFIVEDAGRYLDLLNLREIDPLKGRNGFEVRYASGHFNASGHESWYPDFKEHRRVAIPQMIAVLKKHFDIMAVHTGYPRIYCFIRE
jgi:hypothetical protein